VLDLVDEPVAVVRPDPLDRARPEREALRLHHRRDVRVDDRRQQDQDAQADQPANAPPPLLLASALEPARDIWGSGRIQDDRRYSRVGERVVNDVVEPVGEPS